MSVDATRPTEISLKESDVAFTYKDHTKMSVDATRPTQKSHTKTVMLLSLRNLTQKYLLMLSNLDRYIAVGLELLPYSEFSHFGNFSVSGSAKRDTPSGKAFLL